jgi:hypothetical protein
MKALGHVLTQTLAVSGGFEQVYHTEIEQLVTSLEILVVETLDLPAEVESLEVAEIPELR